MAGQASIGTASVRYGNENTVSSPLPQLVILDGVLAIEIFVEDPVLDRNGNVLHHPERNGCAVTEEAAGSRCLARERPWARRDEDVQRAITYFANQSAAGRMDYAARVAANEPIGSGVTEAACKVIVKQRLCGSGMKWKEPGAAAVLSLRCLSHTPERWSQFWAKVDRWGFPVAA